MSIELLVPCVLQLVAVIGTKLRVEQNLVGDRPSFFNMINNNYN